MPAQVPGRESGTRPHTRRSAQPLDLRSGDSHQIFLKFLLKEDLWDFKQFTFLCQLTLPVTNLIGFGSPNRISRFGLSRNTFPFPSGWLTFPRTFSVTSMLGRAFRPSLQSPPSNIILDSTVILQ